MKARIEVIDAVDSTNVEAIRRVRVGERGPLWLRALEQTGGRGRSGRAWASPLGNHYASLIVPLGCPPQVVHQVSLVAGIAVHDAIAAVATPRPLAGLRLKWPNDVLIGEAKLAGILAESTSDVKSGGFIAIVGVGINLRTAPDGLGRAATCLAAHSVDATPESMLAALAPSMVRWLAIWDAARGFDAIRTAWLARAGAVGEAMSVNTGTGPVHGTFAGLDMDGALLMRDGHGISRRFDFGDVTLNAGAGRHGQGDGEPEQPA